MSPFRKGDGAICHHRRCRLRKLLAIVAIYEGHRPAVLLSVTATSFRWVWLTVILAVACQNPTIVSFPEATLRCDDCSVLTVLRIIDGDTLDTAAGRVRLFGIDTPERGEHCYNQATDGLRQLAGNRIRVERGPRAQDRGGRLLYYVYTERGASIDETLLRVGLAVAWTRDGQHRDLLSGLEQAARAAGKGCLWQ